MTSSLYQNPNVYSGYIWLPLQHQWINRNNVPQVWQQRYDAAFAAADTNGHDTESHRARVAWLDTCDDLHAHLNFDLLDEPALRASLEADDLRKRGERAALDAFMSRRVR
jgi:hypothetical protein